MLFSYKAVNAEGRGIRGQLDAINIIDLETRLRRLELDLVRAKPATPGRLPGTGSVCRRELINFCFHLEQLSRSGVPILAGLSDLRDSLDHPRFRSIVAGLISGIEGGQTLSQALAAYPHVFNPVFTSLIRAGEAAGQLPEVLDRLTESLKWEDEVAAHTRALLIYPLCVAAIVLGATLFLMIYLVPQLKAFLNSMGQALPPHTRALFFVSDVLAGHGRLFLGLTALFGLMALPVLQHLPRARLWFDAMKLRAPLVGGVIRKIILSRFASTLAMLYSAGVPILESLRITRDVAGNQAVRHALLDIEQSIQDGRNVAGAFQDAGLFPPLVIRMLTVGESTGNLDRSLLNVSYFYNRDIKESVGRAQALIEPALTLFMGCLLGWIMLSLIGPVYDLTSKVRL